MFQGHGSGSRFSLQWSFRYFQTGMDVKGSGNMLQSNSWNRHETADLFRKHCQETKMFGGTPKGNTVLGGILEPSLTVVL